MFSMEVEADEIIALNEQIQATEKQIKIAFNRAANRTTSWMRRTTRNDLTLRLKLRSGVVMKRRLIIRRRNNKGLSFFQFWIGLNDLRIEDFKGRPAQSANGIVVGDHYVKGGFFMRAKNGKLVVMKRSKDARLPLERVTAPIEDEARAIIERVYDRAGEFFLKAYRKELFGMIARGYGE